MAGTSRIVDHRPAPGPDPPTSLVHSVIYAFQDGPHAATTDALNGGSSCSKRDAHPSGFRLAAQALKLLGLSLPLAALICEVMGLWLQALAVPWQAHFGSSSLNAHVAVVICPEKAHTIPGEGARNPMPPCNGCHHRLSGCISTAFDFRDVLHDGYCHGRRLITLTKSMPIMIPNSLLVLLGKSPHQIHSAPTHKLSVISAVPMGPLSLAW